MKLFHYLKYFFFHVIGLLSLGTLHAGGDYIILGFLAIILFYVIGDAIGGDDTSTPEYNTACILSFQLWLALPLLALIFFSAVWRFSTVYYLGFWCFAIH